MNRLNTLYKFAQRILPDKFARVDNNLLRGACPSNQHLQTLKNNFGVKKIISLDEPLGNEIHKYCKELNLEHIIIPLTDGNGPNVNKLPSEVVQWTKGGPTYVHCKHGKDRTGMACAMYRVLVNGWDVDDAIIEAHKFGMGYGLSPSIRDSYYDAVRKYVGADQNNVSDIVRLHRDKVEELHPKPGYQSFNPASSAFYDGGDQEPLGMQQSFAPYMDSTTTHLYMPANIRRQELLKLAALDQVFIYSSPSQVMLGNQIWTDNISSAKRFSNGDKLYMAKISNHAKIEKYPHEPTKTLIHAAMLKEADVAIFSAPNVPTQYFIINPVILNDIKEINDDINNVPSVGQHDNYTGAANLVFPGSGGFMGPNGGGTLVPGSGGGGFAGIVNLPYTQNL